MLHTSHENVNIEILMIADVNKKKSLIVIVPILIEK
jgi:hypothetical protein